MDSKPCEIITIAHLLGKKWTFPIIQIFQKKKEATYKDIDKFANHTIGPRALSRALKDLLQLNIINKHTKNQKQLYYLTEHGEKLLSLMKAVKAWCHTNDLHVPEGCNLRCIECRNFALRSELKKQT